MGFIYLFFLPVRLPSNIRKLPPDLPVIGFPGVWKLPLLQLPSRKGSPSLALLSLFLSFIILSYLLLKTMGCFSGCLMSSASDQNLFFVVCSAFKCSFDEFVGEKVVSPSYSSSILALPTPVFFPGESQGRGRLVGCRLWGRTELDTTDVT